MVGERRFKAALHVWEELLVEFTDLGPGGFPVRNINTDITKTMTNMMQMIESHVDSFDWNPVTWIVETLDSRHRWLGMDVILSWHVPEAQNTLGRITPWRIAPVIGLLQRWITQLASEVKMKSFQASHPQTVCVCTRPVHSSANYTYISKWNYFYNFVFVAERIIYA